MLPHIVARFNMAYRSVLQSLSTYAHETLLNFPAPRFPLERTVMIPRAQLEVNIMPDSLFLLLASPNKVLLETHQDPLGEYRDDARAGVIWVYSYSVVLLHYQYLLMKHHRYRAQILCEEYRDDPAQESFRVCHARFSAFSLNICS